MKYLGFQLDNTLSFGAHFEYMYKKISKKLYFFSRIANNLSTETKITVYQSIIQPHFDYCSSVLYQFNLNKLAQIQKLQNRGMRIILKTNRYTPINIMLTTLQWLSVSQRLFYFTMILVYKIVNNLAPSYFQNYVVFHSDLHNHLTRNGMNIYITKTNYKNSMNSLFFKGFDQFNKLPNQIKMKSSVTAFKRELIKYIKNMV